MNNFYNQTTQSLGNDMMSIFTAYRRLELQLIIKEQNHMTAIILKLKKKNQNHLHNQQYGKKQE